MPDRRDLLSEAVDACPIDGQEMRPILLEIEDLVDALDIDKERHDVGDLRHMVLRRPFGIVLLDDVSQALVTDVPYLQKKRR
jgi:hypothetical protein